MYIWGEGRGSGRVGSDFMSAIAGRVVSGQRFAGSGRVQEKWPVDNSGKMTTVMIGEDDNDRRVWRRYTDATTM